MVAPVGAGVADHRFYQSGGNVVLFAFSGEEKAYRRHASKSQDEMRVDAGRCVFREAEVSMSYEYEVEREFVDAVNTQIDATIRRKQASRKVFRSFAESPADLKSMPEIMRTFDATIEPAEGACAKTTVAMLLIRRRPSHVVDAVAPRYHDRFTPPRNSMLAAIRQMFTSRQRWTLIAAILALTPQSLPAFEPQLSIDQLHVRRWGTDQGLPQGTIYAMAQAPDGHLWCGTQEGFARFDGSAFVLYDKTRRNQIKSNSVSSLLVAGNGTVFVGTGSGLLTVVGDRIHRYGTAEGLPSDTVTTLFSEGNDVIWIGTARGFARWDRDGRIVPFATDQLPSPVITAFAKDASGRLWVGTMRGIAMLTDGRISRLQAGRFPAGHILSLYGRRDGSMWISVAGEGLLRFNGVDLRAYDAKDGLPSNNVATLYEDHNGVLWVGTWDRGLGRLRADRFAFDLEALGLSKTVVTAILEDREGSLWIGLRGGLAQVVVSTVRTFTTNHGLGANNVRSVQQDHAGNLWVGTGHGLQRFSLTRNHRDANVSDDQVLSSWVASDDTFWIGTSDKGLKHVAIAGGRATTYDTRTGLYSNLVQAVYESRDGTIWVGTDGLQRIVHGKLVAEELKLSGEGVDVIYEDRTGALWAGTQTGGVSRIASGIITTFTTADGLSNNCVLAIHEDASGTMWLGTHEGGLNRFKNGQWTTITTREGLPSDDVFAILEDDGGFFWMSCNKGIFRVARQQLEAVADGKEKRVTGNMYGRGDGMESPECNGGAQPVAWKTTDARMWFATTGGLAMIDPATNVRTTVAPVVTIEGVFGDSQLATAAKVTTVGPGTQTVEFHYSAISLVAPQRLHYQYQLDGVDAEWIDAGALRVAPYNDLRSGLHEFTVRAAVGDGPWSAATCLVRIVPLPAWRRWWLVELSVLVVAIGTISWKVRRWARLAHGADHHGKKEWAESLGGALTVAEFQGERQQDAPEEARGELLEGFSESVRPPSGVRTRSRELARDASDDLHVGIITMKEEEMTAVLALLPETVIVKKRRHYNTSRVTLPDQRTCRVGVVRCVEQGTGEAQAIARDFVHDLFPHWLLVVGIAGGAPRDEFSLGDVVISTKVYDLTVESRSTGGKEEFQISGGWMPGEAASFAANLSAMRKQLGSWNSEDRVGNRPDLSFDADRFYGDAAWRKRVHESVGYHHGTRRAPKYTSGPVASSDRLLKDEALLQFWLTFARDTYAIEMETAGVYRAVREEQTPLLAIRGISDIVGYERSREWTDYACRTSASFTRALIDTGALM